MLLVPHIIWALLNKCTVEQTNHRNFFYLNESWPSLQCSKLSCVSISTYLQKFMDLEILEANTSTLRIQNALQASCIPLCYRYHCRNWCGAKEVRLVHTGILICPSHSYVKTMVLSSGSLKDMIFPRYLIVKGLLSNLVKACFCLNLVPGWSVLEG